MNSTASRYEDEDYIVAAIRHEMVHARLMRLTLKHLADWKQKPEGLSFTQYVDKKVTGTDKALVKDRFFGGHMDEVVAYAEGFLSAFFSAPVAAPGTGTPAWIAHFEGFHEGVPQGAYKVATGGKPLPKRPSPKQGVSPRRSRRPAAGRVPPVRPRRHRCRPPLGLLAELRRPGLERRVVEHPAHGGGDLRRRRLPGQLDAGAARGQPRGVVGLVPARRHAHDRHAGHEALHHRPVPTVGHEHVGVGEHLVMRRRAHYGHAGRRVDLRRVNRRPGGHQAADG